jgi:succinate dehydrogenase / fumarate reductase, cytochrome b subunit
MFSSFANRASGVVQSIGLLVLAYWLMAVASGAVAYEQALKVLATPIFKLFYALLLLTFSYHLVAGIRHLVWDTGTGMERLQSQKSAWLIIVVGLLLAAILIYWALSPGAHHS